MSDVRPIDYVTQSDAALDRRAGMRRRHRTLADDLRELWRAAALTSWAGPQPWWTPAIDTVVRAVADGRDPVAGVNQLGRDRATARIGLAAAVDDLNLFYRSSTGLVAPPRLVRAMVEGWRAGGGEATALSGS